MTTVFPVPGELPVLSTTECPICSTVVPDASFCGACGSSLVHSGPTAARRLHSYSAFPDEPVLRLSAVTALFPQLSSRGRAPFRAALAVIAALLLTFALIGAAGPLIALCAFGVPLLFLLYIWEVDPYESSFVPPTALSLAVGAGLGVGWGIIGGHQVDQALLPLLGNGPTNSHGLIAAVLVPGIGQLLMCVPLLLVWALQRGHRESLDGFAAGASGALGFTLAATVVLMAPWFSDGQLVHQPFISILAQTVLRGVSLPIISALTTGFIGAAVWTTTGTLRTAAQGRWLSSPLFALTVALLVQIGLGFADVSFLSGLTLILVHLAAVGIAILVVRIGIHHVLLEESHQVVVGPPTACAHCGHLVPAMAFCPQCGVAERALSRPVRPRQLARTQGDPVAPEPGGAS
jgi:hypothetical protein